MSPKPWFEWVDTFPTSIAIRESYPIYTFLLTTHVLSLCIFAGLVVMMDLRLIGVGHRGVPVTQIQKRLFPWQMLGLLVSGITGLVLLYGQPMRYYGKIFFWIKMSLFVLAGINAMAFHLTTYRSVGSWDVSLKTPQAARVAGVLSLVLWAGVILFGRITAYNWLD
jgi:hypothetical protein